MIQVSSSCRNFFTFSLLCIIYCIINSQNANALSPIRITEIMYDPAGNGSKEFIEFYNGSDTTVSLAGWSTFGVDFVFPGGASIVPGAYTVIARNKPALQASHPSASISGQYGGKLKGSGELIRLYDASGNTMSQVSYSFGGAWPSAARNGGPSLSLISTTANEALPGCWGISSSQGGSPGYADSSWGSSGVCSNVGYPFTPPPTPPPSSNNNSPQSYSSNSNQQSNDSDKNNKKQSKTNNKTNSNSTSTSPTQEQPAPSSPSPLNLTKPKTIKEQEQEAKVRQKEDAKKAISRTNQMWGFVIVFITAGSLVGVGLVFIRYRLRHNYVKQVLEKAKK